MDDITEIGRDPYSGRRILVQRGGVLEYATDTAALESAAAFLGVVDAVLDAEQEASVAELAALLRPAVEALREVLGIAARYVGDGPSDVAWGEAARELGRRLRAGGQ
ncbi:hypothetical protein ACIREM_43495 [Streptomyces shenzhenensis]|uniref:hypothetical protein n=1 Tax=Streptomyces shenzhenensis TaxID=943815 RepID=UPI003818322F